MIRVPPIALNHSGLQATSPSAFGRLPPTEALGTRQTGTFATNEGSADAFHGKCLPLITLNSVGLPLLVVDQRPRIVFANRAMLQLACSTRSRLIGQHPFMLRSDGDAGPTRHEIISALRSTGSWNGTLELRLPNQLTAREFWITINPLEYPAGRLLGHVAAFCEPNGIDPAYSEMKRLAYRDPLTGLANRRWLLEQLALCTRGKRREQTPFALLFIDLDQFKSINDNLGHAIGDETLQAVAKRLQRALRKTDMAARLAGDEFVAVIHNTRDLHDVAASTQKALDAIARPLFTHDATINVTASIGVARFPEDATDASALLAKADHAMYRAKHLGGHCYQVFMPAP